MLALESGSTALLQRFGMSKQHWHLGDFTTRLKKACVPVPFMALRDKRIMEENMVLLDQRLSAFTGTTGCDLTLVGILFFPLKKCFIPRILDLHFVADACRSAPGVLRWNIPSASAFTGAFVGDRWGLAEHGDQAHWRCLVIGGPRQRHRQFVKFRAAPRRHQEGYGYASWIEILAVLLFPFAHRWQ